MKFLPVFISAAAFIAATAVMAKPPTLGVGEEYVELGRDFGFVVTAKTAAQPEEVLRRETLPDGSTRMVLAVPTAGKVSGYFVMKVKDSWVPVVLQLPPGLQPIETQ